MKQKKKPTKRGYVVIWISKTHPYDRRGVLPGFHTRTEAQKLAELRNETFPHEFYWVSHPPKFHWPDYVRVEELNC